MTTSTASNPVTARFGRLATAISVLSSLTALVHLYIGVLTTVMVAGDPATAAEMGGAAMLGVMAALFYLSFVGYVVLNVALYRRGLRRYRRLVRGALIAWAAGNVVAYVVLAQGHYDAFGIADKLCELALIALLVLEGRRSPEG